MPFSVLFLLLELFVMCKVLNVLLVRIGTVLLCFRCVVVDFLVMDKVLRLLVCEFGVP